ncbi:flavodoxin-dependent (E)-4-hydroxy-3-methylbut-2-enyl-diphosphate synthase [Desulfobaculum bizertense]|uniref:4-hydroxy-3-methylbut-2-en-1-yl diphosphate synthase (flavodoxin) n=1 Tax=Desulfobaculum bizertense DSM 18034 TaxID=1121442 RepID=A0A1T4WHA3_9BACT|nr:flavodoxin-dependent (E)-4-hydroxy-3-methylbut-2-enyl-diphosphate synthase [Desulfobaculum bizertense]UIJ39377.1 flavodoxin-dependent (E)-4-hydroxy-3-methylbut-2-enyl-diphosphate synthase [Desulfobaculum bizertense]SKA76587.1 4-hydroxy-3-methylbut-2-en-1-yl diphosphate synthase [Desulfobaculum bizertense DSM 18034]
MDYTPLMPRRKSRVVHVGNVPIGGNNPVVVQSMCNTDTRDVEATCRQIDELAQAGCEIVRLAVLDEDAAKALEPLCRRSPVPLIADIHFDHRLALAAVDAGISALRINPGNIGSESAVDAVVKAAKAAQLPIRIGVNSGSVEKALLKKFGGPSPEAMVESALGHVRLLEERDFYDTKISLKSSSVLNTIAAYRLLATRCDYPLHIGVTEAGTLTRGTVKSSVGLGILLAGGIGDTMRVSLTADPVEEMGVAWEILRSLGLRARGPEIVSCPTCGRTEIDLVHLAEEVERHLRHVTEVFTVAVMGCVVNGPGEAREADIGIAGGRDLGIIFRKGKVIRKVKGNDNLIPAFLEELDKFLLERRNEEN